MGESKPREEPVRSTASKQHYRRLKEAIRGIIVDKADPRCLSDVAAAAIQRGLDVDPGSLHAPRHVLEAEARYVCLAIPSLSPLHKQAREWLAWKFRKDPSSIEPSIPWNLALGGTIINQETGR